MLFCQFIHCVKENEEVVEVDSTGGSSSLLNPNHLSIIDKIELHNFWESLYSNQLVISLLKDYFAYVLKDVAVNVKTIEIHSVFNNTLLDQNERKANPDKLYIQFSGESYYNSPSLYDISLIPALPSNNPTSIVISFMFGGQHLYIHKLWDPLYTKRNAITKKASKFACFIVSNPIPEDRINFYNILSNVYEKKIDSCGQYGNNIGYLPPPIDTKEYYEFLSQYKFMICFENKQQDYYFTEKLINAYIGKTIPIYWGCPQLPEFININAIVYIPSTSEEDISMAIQRIIELDNNHEKYKEVFEQPLFLGSSLPAVIDKDAIRGKINDAYKIRKIN